MSRLSYLSHFLILGVGIGALCLSCGTAGSVAEPTVDEQGYALVSAMNQLLSLSSCVPEGRYWREDDQVSSTVGTGRALGVAGVGKGLLMGAVELDRLGIAGDDEVNGDAYYQGALDAARWLKSIARVTLENDAFLVSWPQCYQGDAVPAPPEEWEAYVPEELSCEGESAHLTFNVCPDSLTYEAADLRDGAAGVGDFLLDLYEQTSFPQQRNEKLDHLRFAEGVGDWLLARAEVCGEGLCWRETLKEASQLAQGGKNASLLAREESGWVGGAVSPDDFFQSPESSSEGGDATYNTSLADGAAGIGYFLLRLSRHSSDGDHFLEGALLAGTWLESLMVYPSGVTTDGDVIPAFVPETSTSDGNSFGFYQGTAGIAYFFLALYSVTGDLCFAYDAESLLAYVRDSATIDDFSGGLAWTLSRDPTSRTFHTDLYHGNAGIAWTFLQAARVLDPAILNLEQTRSDVESLGDFAILDDSYLSTANQAAEWLASAHNAHYYQGAVWWPSVIEPWSSGASLDEASWPEDSGLEASVQPERYFTHYPGLLRGTAGIGWFLQDLGQHSSDSCYVELADQASRWLYYKGSPSVTSALNWSWSSAITRLISTRQYEGAVMTGLDYGVAGMIAFLARDRAVDDVSGIFFQYSVLGFRMLEPPAVESYACGVQ